MVYAAPMKTPPDPTNIRLTITVTPAVHATFSRLAAAGSMSLSRTMGEWLADTVEAAEFTAQKMEQARSAPRLVAREMHAYALGLADETGALMERVRQKGPAAGKRSAAAGGLFPPSSLTGGKSPGKARG